MRSRFAIACLLALLVPLAAQAQQNAAPEPIVRVAIDPAQVLVGQRATLRVEVLAPNYMTAPPELPGFQLRNAVTRQLQSVNLNEQSNGIEYAGVRFEFAIYPLEAGSYAISDQKLTIKYAAEPPATREAVISLPRIEFQASIPDAAAGLHPFLTATSLTMEQQIQRSSEELKVGDAVTRIVTIKADGTPAMLLPPIAFSPIDGLAVYPAQPSLQDTTEGRSDALSAARVDSATYMLEKPGDYVLPAIDVRWWNAGDGKIALAHLDAVPLQVAANPAAGSAAPPGDAGAGRNWSRLLDLFVDHWGLAVLALAALAGLGWITPRAARAMAADYRHRREAYLRSESFSFSRLRQAARRSDAKAAYFALLDWLQRFDPVAPRHTVASLKSVAKDPALDVQIGAIEQQLFAPRSTDSWSPHQWLRQLGATRRRLQRQAARSARMRSPQQLNPIDDHAASARRRRMPAR
ncbi:BatD family protein [Bradyrhizobium sp. Ai1a-2]|uniref:BatD family protein n=1 Tax=Bradyrhizobium sp. Ai1a-2 TaxID=196490 RepID=UPI00040A1669|nr:BatD family protein [Bradyrhizobium sp. Ai1a-2]